MVQKNQMVFLKGTITNHDRTDLIHIVETLKISPWLLQR